MLPWNYPFRYPDSPNSPDTPDPPPVRWGWPATVICAASVLVIVAVLIFASVQDNASNPAQQVHQATIGQVLTWADQHRLKSAVIQGDQVTVTTTGGTLYTATKEDGQQLSQYLLDHGVNDVSVQAVSGTPFWQQLALYVAPLLVVVFLVLVLWRLARSRDAERGGDRLAAFGRSRASRFAEDHPKVHFTDVAGVQEVKEELQEIVAFLKFPARFTSMGARVPKGVLLVGPPGTGKTLIARAVAGEAGVAFFSTSGAEFVEMYVGVGASRVRDLFAKAKRNAPSIIFVDEIDAVGRQRAASNGSGNDERDQTLNQMLVEIDGFAPRDNVVVMAATNRPDVLDPALLRPGRFDRQVLVDRPDLGGRIAILQVHSVGKPLAPDVSLDALAEQSSGLTGADLANVMNEGALLAARRGSTWITRDDLDEALLRVMAGPERKSYVMSPAEKAIVAYHELGHAIVMRMLPGCDKVRKVTTVSRGMALGLTMSAPSEDRVLLRESELKARLAGLMGGRAAEELTFGTTTTGAAQDIKQATILARRMVCEYGMSSLGTVLIDEDAGVGPELAAQVDAEVRRLLDEAHAVAKDILTAHSDKLTLLAEYLVHVETMDGDELDRRLFEGDELRVDEDSASGRDAALPCSEAPADQECQERG